MSSHSFVDDYQPNGTLEVRNLTDDDTESSSGYVVPPFTPPLIASQIPPAHPPPHSPTTTVPPPSSSTTHDVTRPQKRPRSPNNRQDEEENSCSICCEPWTSSGAHQLVCLPCGHLFGFECIQKWLQSKRRPGCPMCKHPARVRDLRYLFGVPARLQVVDNSECERLKESLENEKCRHEVTKGRLRAMERLVDGLRRDVERAKRGVREFGGGGGAEREAVACVASWTTNGGSATGVFDGKGGLLFGENVNRGWGNMKQKVSRLDIGRGVVVDSSTVWMMTRINRMAICEGESGLKGCVAVGAGEKVRILRRELVLVGDVGVAGGMVCSVMWWGGDKIVVGTERGGIVLMDLRMLDGGCIWRKSVGGNGSNGSWRVHSLGRVGTGMVAGTTGGIYWVGGEGGEVVNLTSEESRDWICGLKVDEEVVAVASRTRGDAGQKGRVVLHDGVNVDGGGVELGRTRLVVEGHRQTLPFSLPGVVGGRGGEGEEVFVCMGDGQTQGGVRVWGEDGGKGVCAEWRGALRSTVGMRLPRTARLGRVRLGTQALFGCVGDEVVKVYGVGRYS